MLTKNVKLFDGKLTMDIPAEFLEICEENFSKYCQAGKPCAVFSNDDKGATLAVSQLGLDLVKEDVEKRVQEYVTVYQRSIPNFANCKVALRNLNENECLGIFCFTSTTVERDLFNYVVLGSVCGKEALIIMHCNISDCPMYIESFIKSINSINIID